MAIFKKLDDICIVKSVYSKVTDILKTENPEKEYNRDTILNKSERKLITPIIEDAFEKIEEIHSIKSITFEFSIAQYTIAKLKKKFPDKKFDSTSELNVEEFDFYKECFESYIEEEKKFDEELEEFCKSYELIDLPLEALEEEMNERYNEPSRKEPDEYGPYCIACQEAPCMCSDPFKTNPNFD